MRSARWLVYANVLGVALGVGCDGGSKPAEATPAKGKDAAKAGGEVVAKVDGDTPGAADEGGKADAAADGDASPAAGEKGAGNDPPAAAEEGDDAAGAAPADPAEGIDDPAAAAVDDPSAATQEDTDPVAEGGDDAAAVPPAPREASTVTVTKPRPAPKTVAWRTVATPADAIELQETVVAGVIGKSPSGWYDVDDEGALKLRREIEAPASPLLGWWPKNAWHIEHREKIDAADRSMTPNRTIRLMRLRGNRRWVPQDYGRGQRFPDEDQEFAIGGKGGLLALDDGSLARVAGQAADPEVGEMRGDELVAFFETKKGRLYTVSRGEGTLYVQTVCEDEACVANAAMKMPNGDRWGFAHPIPRQRNSITAVATRQADTGAEPHLLHYETGGWTLEALDDAPAGVWPTKDGGMWTRVGDALLHRDPDGVWHTITLPDGAIDVSVAMRRDQSEVWVSTIVAATPTVFATHANAQQPPPEPPPEAPPE